MKKLFAAAMLVAFTAAAPGAGATDLRTLKDTSVSVEADPQVWAGVYFGIMAGYGQSSFEEGVKRNSPAKKTVATTSVPAADSFDAGNFRGTAELGYDFQVGRLVFGPVAEWTFLSESQEFSGGSNKISATHEWAAGGRLGVLISPQNLAYAKIMYVERGTKGEYGITASGNADVIKDTRSGYAVGLGYDHAFTRNLIGGIEARYTKFDDVAGKSGNTTVTSSVDDIAVMVRMRYLLNTRF